MRGATSWLGWKKSSLPPAWLLPSLPSQPPCPGLAGGSSQEKAAHGGARGQARVERDTCDRLVVALAF